MSDEEVKLEETTEAAEESAVEEAPAEEVGAEESETAAAE